MLDYNILTKLAQEAAQQKHRERPTVEAVFLVGSVARRDSVLPTQIDIDLLLVDYNPPSEPDLYPFQWLSDQVLVECHTLDARIFQDKKLLRTDPLLAPILNEAITLFDPRHLLDVVQAGLRSRFWDAETTYQRARAAYQTAWQAFRGIARYSRMAAPKPFPLADLNTLFQIVEASSLAIFNIGQQPPFGRAHWQNFAQVCQNLGRPELWQHMQQVFGQVSGVALADVYDLWQVLVQAERGHPSLEWETSFALETRERYWQAAYTTFSQANTPEYAFFIFVQEILRIARLPYAAEIMSDVHYERFLAILGKQETANISESLQAARHLVELLDDLMLNWAQQQNIPY